MRLIYCGDAGLVQAEEYGRLTWGLDVQLDYPLLHRSRTTYNGIPAEEIPVKQFGGAIYSIDDEYDTVYIEVVNDEGVRREFGAVGDGFAYILGRRMAVRYVETSKPSSGFAIIDILEVWVDS